MEGRKVRGRWFGKVRISRVGGKLFVEVRRISKGWVWLLFEAVVIG